MALESQLGRKPSLGRMWVVADSQEELQAPGKQGHREEERLSGKDAPA